MFTFDKTKGIQHFAREHDFRAVVDSVLDHSISCGVSTNQAGLDGKRWNIVYYIFSDQ